MTTATADVPPGWRAELGWAFERYYAGNYAATVEAAVRIATQTRDAELRTDAEALAALATLRQAGRENRLDGRTRLANLADRNPDLLDRPECRFAYGLGQLELRETASALLHLQAAADGFEQAGRTERLKEALVALADGWSRHTEWQDPTPIITERPRSRAETDRIRRESILNVRERANGLADADETVRRIDLRLAEVLCGAEDPALARTGVELLARIAEGEPLTPARGEATLRLAELAAEEGRADDARRLYERLSEAELGSLSLDAAATLRDLLRPSIDLDAPAQVRPDEPVVLGLTVRNVVETTVEIRRVALEPWLRAQRGRLNEAQLPTTGALVQRWTLDTASEQTGAPWRSEASGEPLRCTLPAGAYVVHARGRGVGDRDVEQRRLLIASPLQAVTAVGQHRGTVAVHRAADDAGDAGTTRALFWMHGSFVPQKLAFEDGIAHFEPPPESRMLRDRRWVCLIETEDDVALCAGSLPQELRPVSAPRFALVLAPQRATAGAPLTVAGLVETPARFLGEPEGPGEVQLALFDTLGTELSSVAAPVNAAGGFVAALPMPDSHVDELLRVVLRHGDRVLPTVPARVLVQAGAPGPATLEWTASLPFGRDRAEPLIGSLRAQFPCGAAFGDRRVGTQYRAVRLPMMNPWHPGQADTPLEGDAHLDPTGRGETLVPLMEFELGDGPLAARIVATLQGPDGRQYAAEDQTLVGPGSAGLWFTPSAEPVRAGEPVVLSVGWYDPKRLATGLPRVTITRVGSSDSWQPALYPYLGGWLTTAWYPPQAGVYVVDAAMVLSSGEIVSAERELAVSEPVSGGAPLPRCAARYVDAGAGLGVKVDIDRARGDAPLLAILDAGEPLAAAWITPDDAPAATLALPGARPLMAKLRLFRAAADGVRLIGEWPVQADPALSGSGPRNPGGTQPACDGIAFPSGLEGSTAFGLVRLTPAVTPGTLPWTERIATDGSLPDAWTPVATPHGPPTDARRTGVPATEFLLDAGARRLLLGGTTTWLGPLSAPTTSLPADPDGDAAQRVEWIALDGQGVVRSGFDEAPAARLRAELILPPQLSIGDRLRATLRLHNRSGSTERGPLAIDPRPGLAPAAATADDAPVEVAAGESRRVALNLEAVSPGEGVVAVTWKPNGGSPVRAQASYRVLAAPEAPDAPVAKLHRRLLRLVPVDAAPEEEEVGPVTAPRIGGTAPMARIPLRENEPVAPGDLILVEEEVELPRSTRVEQWEQRVPANAVTFATSSQEVRPLALNCEVFRDRYQYGAETLTSGRLLHSYLLVAVHPGTCVLPPPDVARTSPPLRFAPSEEVRLHVVAE